ncbi:hypothetical protein CFELI_13860 [Corynebacterium felinum]|uniref:Uncharacterized protein n=1 Tax=Corynebacterium felinum TaxID=131318 RepID=A0ABU2BCD6_9CORY|nr:hypothetical protein [Corynebacterium felinum]MDR7356302.1 hypothetical protein [Corynebacterium felinum]WJY95636.1 hypothetical protein CFELI_10190 [Corynebacterium felinum]WJY96343.1 hypothetical protein CFELI_13860 [Corynebacterium felinum]
MKLCKNYVSKEDTDELSTHRVFTSKHLPVFRKVLALLSLWGWCVLPPVGTRMVFFQSYINEGFFLAPSFVYNAV